MADGTRWPEDARLARAVDDRTAHKDEVLAETALRQQRNERKKPQDSDNHAGIMYDSL